MTADNPNPKPDAHLISEMLGYQFAALVSRNPQPCMSGDPRDRLLPHLRRQFDDACREAASAIMREFPAALADDLAPTIPSKGDAGEGLKPCPFCGEALSYVQSWARSFAPPRLYHEYNHPKNGCLIGRSMCFRFDEKPEKRMEFLKAWNTRSAQSEPATGEDVARGLVEALEPFTVLADFVAEFHEGWDHDHFVVAKTDDITLTMEPFRRARAALAAYRDRSAAVREAAPPAEVDLWPGLRTAELLIESAEAKYRKPLSDDVREWSSWQTGAVRDGFRLALGAVRKALRAAADPSRPDEGQQGGSDAGRALATAPAAMEAK